MLVEEPHTHHLAPGGIELVAEIEVVDLTGFQIFVTADFVEEVEVVVDGRRHLAKLGPVERTAVGEPQQVLLVEVVGGVDRGQQVEVDVVATGQQGLRGRHRLVAGEAQSVILEAQPGVDVELAQRQLDGSVAGTVEVGGFVGVGLLGDFVDVDLVGTQPGIAHHLFVRQVEVLLTLGHGEVVIAVDKLAGGVAAGAVFAHQAALDGRADGTQIDRALVIDTPREEVVAERLEVARDLLVAHLQLRHVGALAHTGLVDDDASVGLGFVGVAVTYVPRQGVQLVLVEEVVAGQLPQVGEARLVEHLGLFAVEGAADVSLAGTFGQAVFTQHVEEVAELDFVAVAEDKRPVVHGPYPHVVGVLVVDIVVKVDRLVGLRRVDAEPGVDNILYRLVGVAVIDEGGHAYLGAPFGVEPPVDGERQPLVGHGNVALHPPVGVERTGQPCHLVGVAAGHIHVRRHAAREGAFAQVEAQPVGRAAGVEPGVGKLRVGVEPGGVVHLHRVAQRQALGGDADETAGKVGRNFGSRRLIDNHVFDLRTGQHVEREDPAVRLQTRGRVAVDPHVVVALGQSPHHHKAVVENRNARHTLHHLGGIAVERLGYLLRRDTARHLHLGLHPLDERRLGIVAPVGRDHHLLQGNPVLFELDYQRSRTLPGNKLDRYPGRLVREIAADNHLFAGRHALQREVPVYIGSRSYRGILDLDGGSDDGLAALLVLYGSRNRAGSRSAQHPKCKNES